MRKTWLLLPLTAALWACTKYVRVEVPPKRPLAPYGTLGIIDFETNASPEVGHFAAQQFEAYVQQGQPGTPFVELGSREKALAAVAARELDVDALRKLGAKYGLGGIVMGSLSYSQPQTNLSVTDVVKGAGSAGQYVKGDIIAKLVDAKSGAGVWSESAWVKTQVSGVNVSNLKDIKINAGQGQDPRRDMIPELVDIVSEDLRPSWVRQKAK